MGIQINGNTDTIAAIDGALTVSGAELAGTSNINVAGIITATGFFGNVTGNINSTGVSTIATLNVAQSNPTRLNVSGVSTFSTGIVVASGSTSAPSISPSGDSNTGIFFPAADTIAFAEGGTEALRIDSSANIGIGTASPVKKLHIQTSLVSGAARGGGFTQALFESNNASTSYWEFQANSSSTNDILFSKSSTGSYGIVGYDNSTDALRFFANSAERARVSAGGTFYVGTTSYGVPTRIAASDSFSWFSGIYVGAVPNSVNNNSEFVPIHRLGQGQGSQFSGHLIANSWTGNAYLNLHITSLYTSDAINWTIINASANTATISKTTIQLVTATYNSQSWWGFLKNGGGTGLFYINAFIESNAGVGGNLGLRAVTSGYTVTTTHATLNP